MCSLLAPEKVSSTLGGEYGAPLVASARSPWADAVQGTECHFLEANGKDELMLRVYVDHSVEESTELHARQQKIYRLGDVVTGLGDEAYFDVGGVLRVRKGKVRYFLFLMLDDPDSHPKQKEELSVLAEQVAEKL
jgi:hypothetical protein